MAIFKCKMCGGNLDITEGMFTATCEYCGTQQTVPAADNEKKLTLFNRANRLRFGCEFDKAAGVYEAIVADFPEEAEAYWGLVLCKYGIEYVDDPATGTKVPTCHRSSFESIFEDSDFEQTLENADGVASKIYREEAKKIEDLRREIVEVSSKADPYDIFICYKETDENGERTLDSVLAQDLYDALTDKGYKVFFSRITLEDKLGKEYEPYIFAALNSSKVMLAVGTDYEYYNAVWVRNEWGRFLKMMAKDHSKHLIPCFKGIDAYDIPKEFAKLQAQDLGKVGAIQDLLRGIEKLVSKQSKTTQNDLKAQEYIDKVVADMKAKEQREKELKRQRRAEREQEEAEERAERLKTAAIVLTSTVALLVAGVFFVVYYVIPTVEYNNKLKTYNAAIEKMNMGYYDEAMAVFGGLGDFEDSAEKAILTQKRKITDPIKAARVGDFIAFGAYEHDNKEWNGADVIEWQVLEIKDNKVLVISKNTLADEVYNTDCDFITWETCSLRKWLNKDFINTAFTDFERGFISETTVLIDEEESGMDNETQDNVFILSLTDVEKYFKTENDKSIGTGWWLRAQSVNRKAPYVNSEGKIYNGFFVHSSCGVRPAMWIDLEKLD